MEITYLLNSGFLVKTEKALIIFDDCGDPSKKAAQATESGDFERLYVFASHAHFDHFDPHIIDYAPHVTRYIFSNDIRRTKRARIFPQDKTVYLKKYDDWADDFLRVRSFDSTDVGTSFLVDTGSEKIFHAGDFNWWHWSGDTEENQKLAKNAFMKQMKKLDGLAADVAFFPIDGRLGEYLDIGAKEFCARTDIRAIVAMHGVGFPAWRPKADFFPAGKKIAHWSPTEPGATVVFDGAEFS